MWFSAILNVTVLSNYSGHFYDKCVSYLKWSSSLRAMKAKMKAIKASRISYAKIQQMKTMEPSSHSRMIFMFWAEVFLIACGGKRMSHTVHATACRTKEQLQM